MVRVCQLPRIIHPAIGVVGIELTGSRAHGGYTFVDVEDWIDVEHWRWHLGNHGYAVANIITGTTGRKQTVTMHRFLMGDNGTLTIDHINRNKLDNRRANLRWLTQGANNANTPVRSHNRSGLKGVRWHAHSGRWQARITADGQACSLGYFDTPEAAHQVFLAAHRAKYPELNQ